MQLDREYHDCSYKASFTIPISKDTPNSSSLNAVSTRIGIDFSNIHKHISYEEKNPNKTDEKTEVYCTYCCRLYLLDAYLHY